MNKKEGEGRGEKGEEGEDGERREEGKKHTLHKRQQDKQTVLLLSWSLMSTKQ